jgi:hypothetical protein
MFWEPEVCVEDVGLLGRVENASFVTKPERISISEAIGAYAS